MKSQVIHRNAKEDSSIQATACAGGRPPVCAVRTFEIPKPAKTRANNWPHISISPVSTFGFSRRNAL